MPVSAGQDPITVAVLHSGETPPGLERHAGDARLRFAADAGELAAVLPGSDVLLTWDFTSDAVKDVWEATDTTALRETAVAALPERATTVPALIPFDPAARKALELTFRHALRMGHNYVGTEHVLLALLEQEDGDGVLTRSGVDGERVEQAVTEAIAAMTGGGATTGAGES